MEDSAYASGIHCSINAVLPAFKTFRQIPPKSPKPHTRPLRKVFEKTLRCFLVSSGRKASPNKCRISKEERKGNTAGENKLCILRKFWKILRNFTVLRLDESFVLPAAFPFAPLFESCICLRGTADWMHVENRPYFKNLSWRAEMW